MGASTMGGSTMVVVRHGQTAWSRSGRHTGRTDVPLSPEGRVQAGALRALLAGLDVDRVLTSPLARAEETCRLTGFADRAEVVEDLVEWDYGDYEGRTTEEVRVDRPGWSLWTDPVPCGESPSEVGRRADRVVERARSAGGTTLCFGHGHHLRVMAARWVGLPPAAGRLWALDAASVGVLAWEREVPVIRSWNRVP